MKPRLFHQLHPWRIDFQVRVVSQSLDTEGRCGCMGKDEVKAEECPLCIEDMDEHTAVYCVRCNAAACYSCMKMYQRAGKPTKCPFCNLVFVSVKESRAKPELEKLIYGDSQKSEDNQQSEEWRDWNDGEIWGLGWGCSH